MTFDRDFTSPFLRDPDEPDEARRGATASDAPPDGRPLPEREVLPGEADEIAGRRDSLAAEHDLRPADVDPLGTRGEAEGPATDLPPDIPVSDGQAPLLRTDVSGAREHDDVASTPRRRQARPRRTVVTGETASGGTDAGTAPSVGSLRAEEVREPADAAPSAADPTVLAPSAAEPAVLDHPPQMPQRSVVAANGAARSGQEPHDHGQASSGQGSATGAPSTTTVAGRLEAPAHAVAPVGHAAAAGHAGSVGHAAPGAVHEMTAPSTHGTSAAGVDVAVAHDVDSAHVVAGHEDDPRDDHHEAALGPIDWRAWTMSGVGLLAGLAIAVLFYLATIPG